MAEENNLEDNLDEPLDDDGLDSDFLTDEPAFQDGGTPSFITRIKDRILPLLSPRRNQVILGGAVVLIVASSFFFFKGDSVPKGQPQAMAQPTSPTFDGASIVTKKPEKKKKKKIKYVDLYKQLEGTQLAPIVRELSYLNISYNVVQNGKQYDLQVDQDQLDEAKHVLAIKGMPSAAVKGYEIFDEASNLGVTEFDKRIRLIRALSGEMEKAIMEFDVVDYAYVEIVIPETKLFAVTQPPVTASILIKRRNGANINDETVYAIMQLVSSSVENLLPDNISVVDTEGRVLSTGVLDRMTKKIEEIELAGKAPIANVGNGKVIIPAIEDVVDWFQLKFNYETVLEKKALNQLSGVLPAGSFKTAVTIDLNSVSQTGAPDIKQIVTSVVVDDQFEEVDLNAATIDQITQAVAGAVGYVESRDAIHVSKAGFLPKRDDAGTPSLDEDDVQQSIVLPKDTVGDKFGRLVRLWPILGIGCVITATLMVIAFLVKSVFQRIFSVLVGITKLFKRKKKDPEPPEELTQDVPTLIDATPEVVPLTEKDVVNDLKTKADFGSVIQLKAMSSQDTQHLVGELKALLKG